jgi:hypothetical protein
MRQQPAARGAAKTKNFFPALNFFFTGCRVKKKKKSKEQKPQRKSPKGNFKNHQAAENQNRVQRRREVKEYFHRIIYRSLL